MLGIRNLSLPKNKRQTVENKRPLKAGKESLLVNHCSMNITMNNAVKTKSSPSVLKETKELTSEPIIVPLIQYM